jgi:hypothetical protein
MILTLTGKKMLLVIKKSEEPPENSKTSRGPYKGLVLKIFVKLFEIYLMRQSL